MIPLRSFAQSAGLSGILPLSLVGALPHLKPLVGFHVPIVHLFCGVRVYGDTFQGQDRVSRQLRQKVDERTIYF